MAGIQQALLAGNTVLTYATWNPSDKNVNITLSGGNLVADATSNSNFCGRATIAKSSRKWYWEVLIGETGAGNIEYVGVANSTMPLTNGFNLGQDTNGYGYSNNGSKYYNSSSLGPVAYGATYGNGDIISVLLDLDAGEITYWKNGISQGVAFTGVSGTYYPAYCLNLQGTVSKATVNFGASAWAFSPPAGYNNGVYS